MGVMEGRLLQKCAHLDEKFLHVIWKVSSVKFELVGKAKFIRSIVSEGIQLVCSVKFEAHVLVPSNSQVDTPFVGIGTRIGL